MEIPGEGSPGATPLERLESFKGLLNDTLTGLAEGTHGSCQVCNEPIRGAELDEMPWATVCGGCAGKQPA